MITATANTDGTVDLVGVQNTEWEFEVELFEDDARTIPFDLAGYAVEGFYRKDIKESSPKLITFTCSVTDTNKILVRVLPEDNADITQMSGKYYVRIFDALDNAEKVMKGKLTISF